MCEQSKKTSGISLKYNQRLLIIVNDPAFFLSHRAPVAVAAKKKGFDVHVATAYSEAAEQIISLGLNYHRIPMTRSGLNPISEIRCLVGIYKLIKDINPHLIHLVTIKPVLYGGFIARLLRVPAIVAAISGLGSVFVASSISGKIRKYFVLLIYRLSLGHKNIKVIFQNPDDKYKLLKANIVDEKDSVMIRGSGVEISSCPVIDEPEGPPIVVMAARLLKEKGVLVFVEAAKLIQAKGIKCRFFLAGTPDPGNPSSITNEEIRSWVEQGIIEALGFRSDIPDVFANAHIVTLPSFYGEGLPKVLIEAAACARPVVTTDNPGCRDAIEKNVTGLLVPTKDAIALAGAFEKLLLDKALRIQMGKAGRNLAEREFTIESVVNKHLSIYSELLANNER